MYVGYFYMDAYLYLWMYNFVYVQA